MAKVRIRVSKKTGKAEMRGEGFVGDACVSAIASLTNSLGGQVEAAEHTAEFYQEPEIEIEQHINLEAQ